MVEVFEYVKMQEKLSEQLVLSNRVVLSDVKVVAGVDIAYGLSKSGRTIAACCAVFCDYRSGKILERSALVDYVDFPYISGLLSFRELPLILRTLETLRTEPDLYVFDGNGYLHARHMGVASHASIELNKPVIGVSKTQYCMPGIEYFEPLKVKGSYTDIVCNGEVLGCSVRTKQHRKPVYVSQGGFIDLAKACEAVLHLSSVVNRRLPAPVYYADEESRALIKEVVLF